MVSTRSAAANGEKASAGAAEKHQTEHETPEAKRQKKTQTTLEESLNDHGENKPGSGEGGAENQATESSAQPGNDEDKKGPKKEPPETAASDDTNPRDGTANADKNATGKTAVRHDQEEAVPSNVLEKGIVYFFIRGRVGIDEPTGVNDIARTYMILRPIDASAKLGDGPIGDAGNSRLIAIPKKVLPKGGQDRFMTFVEESEASFSHLKKTFLDSSDYETKTAGTRHSPAATPVGEGVYAITTTGRESHLAYMTTLPEKLGNVQQRLGLKEQGSFILSTKNPQYEGPAYATLPEGPEYPERIINEFRSLRWMPSKPEHLDYRNSQFLLIGHSSGLEKATEPQEDQEDAKEDPKEVLEHLEEEDLERMRHLSGGESASVFADLQVRAADYPKIQTTF